MNHEVWKNDVLYTVIIVDGAWIDTVKRKLTVPPDLFKEIFAIITKDKSESINNKLLLSYTFNDQPTVVNIELIKVLILKRQMQMSECAINKFYKMEG